MYSRILVFPSHRSFFLFGPRGTGKSHWVRSTFPRSTYLDLLDSTLSTPLMAEPKRLGDFIPDSASNEPVIIDEVQRVPAVLDEVHRLIETKGLRFVLTGSSARKLRTRGVNLLAGRAVTRSMHPLTALETGSDFVLEQLRALNDGLRLGYELYYWRTRDGLEVDFVLYGERGILALEVKRARTVRGRDLRGLRAFKQDYPMARVILLYGGDRRMRDGEIDLIPVEQGLRTLAELLNADDSSVGNAN